MKEKLYIKTAADVEEIITKPMGYGLVTDRITVDGQPITYMYREIPDNKQDSGWRFFSGDEDDNYLDDENNISIMNINTIAHYDQSILPFLESDYDTAFAKDENGNFVQEDFEQELD